MKITIEAETKEEMKNFKKKVYKNISDYYVDVRCTQKKLISLIDGGSWGDPYYLIGRLYSAIFSLKEHIRQENDRSTNIQKS